jgi:hypothetical protein
MTSDDQGADSEPVDLTPLASLRLDPARRSTLAARIAAAAGPRLDRRAAGLRASPAAIFIDTLARSARPALIGAAAAMLLAVAVGRGTTTSGSPETNGVAAGLLSLGTSEQSLAGGSAADPTWIIEQRTPTDADLARAIGLETGTQESQ